MMLWGSPYISWYLNFDPKDTIWWPYMYHLFIDKYILCVEEAAEPRLYIYFIIRL